MQKTIGYQQRTHGNVKMTRIVSVVSANPEYGQQLSLFAERTWQEEMKSVIHKFHIFYPSEVEVLCSVLPPKDCFVGGFYRNLANKKQIVKTGEYRRSPRESRRGGIEWQYRNICL